MSQGANLTDFSSLNVASITFLSSVDTNSNFLFFRTTNINLQELKIFRMSNPLILAEINQQVQKLHVVNAWKG